MNADTMYQNTIATLRRSVEQHETPSGKSSIKAFCEAYGFSRQNLTEILNGKQEISIALFTRISAILGGREARPMPEGVERWSLRTWLQVDAFAIQQDMYQVNFAG